jgi:O-antigen biosynthesis protein WbqP
MNFVGPRPALFNQEDLMVYRVATGVSKLKPGITGWAQINGRDEISIPDKIKFEQEYMYRKSTLFDLEIILKTISSVLRKKGVKH